MSALFRSKVRTFGPRFMSELALEQHHVSGIFGNIGTETGGFKHRQEIAPTVKGSKGGIGWPQWTGYGKGGRRGPFERWVKTEGRDLSTEAGYDEACFDYMLIELRGSEKAALAALKRTKTVEAATETFMLRYERPGVPHLDQRQEWAAKAAVELAKVMKTAPVPKPAEKPVQTPPEAVEPVSAPAPANTGPSVFARLWAFLRGRPTVPPAAPAPVPATAEQQNRYVQSTLQAKGYTEVGEVDGKIGRRTKEAVRNAREAAKLPAGDMIDQAFLAALPTLPQKPIAAARAAATVETLKSEGQPAVTNMLGVGKIFAGLLGLGGAQAADQAGLFSGLQQLVGDLQTTIGAVASIVSTGVGFVRWLLEHPWIIYMALAFFGLRFVANAVLDIVVKFKQGFLTKAGA